MAVLLNLNADSKNDFTNPKKLIMKKWNLILACFLFLMTLLICCEKDDDSKEEAKSKVTCTASCSSMTWSIAGQTGTTTRNEDCTNQWIGNNYIQTCNGTITYENTNKTYTFHVVYDWIDCDITINVSGVGSCTDKVKSTKSAPCDCLESLPDEPAVIVYKE
jgi:hypothetical protein